MIALPPTEEVRKAAAFVEKIAALERDFGFRLGVGTMAHDGDDFEPVTFGEGDIFALIRTSDDELPGALGLAIVPTD